MLLARNYFGKITLHNFFMHLVPLKGIFFQIFFPCNYKVNYELWAREAVSLPVSLLILSPNIRWHSNAFSSAMQEEYTAKHSQSPIIKSAPVPGELSVSQERQEQLVRFRLVCLWGRGMKTKKMLCLVGSEIEKGEKGSLWGNKNLMWENCEFPAHGLKNLRRA